MVATYVLAPLPNAICSRCTNPDDFDDSNGFIDLGRFLTGFFVIMGIGEHLKQFLLWFQLYRSLYRTQRWQALAGHAVARHDQRITPLDVLPVRIPSLC